MTRHYCDICNSELYVKNPVKVLVAPGINQDYDLCNTCGKAIDNARNKAEIEIVQELGRKKV